MRYISKEGKEDYVKACNFHPTQSSNEEAREFERIAQLHRYADHDRRKCRNFADGTQSADRHVQRMPARDRCQGGAIRGVCRIEEGGGNDRAQGRARRIEPCYRDARPGWFDLRDAPIPRFDLLARPQAAPPGSLIDPRRTGEIHRLGAYNRVTIQTTRGCPIDCDFCAASKLYSPRYRIKPVERVLAEVDAVRSLWRQPFIEFADDNRFVDKTWAKRLLRGLAGRRVRYFTETDVSVADDEELLTPRCGGCSVFSGPSRGGSCGFQ